MTLDEYVEKAKKELDDFKKEYLKEYAKDPKNWPLEMDEGEWDEQENAYHLK